MLRALSFLPLLVLAAPARAVEPAARFEDDYPAALAAAKARDVPIFVDAWAPW